ncbi:hypothetical protein P0082_11215 [Candidatus Haliotispira prima]|uniref:Lipoprotein n=1 Tax=Candidatus Haliotispira prima TaxID=3034016 RepID=A0ABY8MIN0_9SPIO|nr:hypothetical protein P0082_11215 [Candidatus Haliotispira prima]
MKHIAVFSLLLLSSVFFSCDDLDTGTCPLSTRSLGYDVEIEGIPDRSSCSRKSPCSLGSRSLAYNLKIEGIPDRSKIGGFDVVYSNPEDPPPWFGTRPPDKKFRLRISARQPVQQTGPGSLDFRVQSPWRYCADPIVVDNYIPIADKAKIPYLSFALTYDGTIYNGGPLLKYRYGQMEVDRDKVKESPRPKNPYDSRFDNFDLGTGDYTIRFSDLEKNELKETLELTVIPY